MADFSGDDLRGARFERTNLTGAQFRGVDLTGARFGGVDLTGAVMRGVDLVNVEISGQIENVTVNGIDIAPLITAELDRRHPDLARMRPDAPPGFGQAWDLLERLWAETTDRARALPPGLLDESVDDEWSFLQTLRHLVFATDAWIGRAVLGDRSPWEPLGLPWEEGADIPGLPGDRDARPSLDTVLGLRRERRATVRRVIDGLTAASLDSDTEPVEAGFGWPPPRRFKVRECLLIILNEEWWHRQYAERDLAVLQARPA